MALSSWGIWRERVDQGWGSGLPTCPSAGMIWIPVVDGAVALILSGLAPEKERGALAHWTKSSSAA